MPANFRIENLDALARTRASLAALRDGADKVISRAIATLRRRLPVAARRDIAAAYNVKPDDVRKRLLCTGDSSSVTLTALGRPLTLIKFSARQNSSGVAVQIHKGETAQIDHAFIRVPANAPGAGPQVMIRDAALSLANIPNDVVDIAVIDHSRHGYPIVLLGGPSVGDMLREGDREERLDDVAQETFAKEVDRLAEVARGK
jgi:hypothetical protein